MMLNTMDVLPRLKMELNNRSYFTDEEYGVFLMENDLHPKDIYDKYMMQRQLLLTCVDILNALANDVDNYRRVQNNDLMSTSEAYKYLSAQIENLKQRIASIPIPEDAYSNSCWNLMFSKNR